VKITKALTIIFLVQCFFLSTAIAGDFGWIKNLNIKAETDLSSYRLQLATRFRIGDAEVRAVIGNVDRPSDAYMVLRMGEMTHRPVKKVLQIYHQHKKRGWGAMAKQMGIKPGSKSFHALKRGHDLHHDGGHDRGDHMMKGNGKGKGKDKKKGNKKDKGK